MKRLCLLTFLATPLWAGDDLTATGDLGLVIERATGSLVLIDRSDRVAVGQAGRRVEL